MTGEDILSDLRERIDRGLNHLGDLRREADERLQEDLRAGDLIDRSLSDLVGDLDYWVREKSRLEGKAEGLCVVRDWLRSYDGLLDDGRVEREFDPS